MSTIDFALATQRGGCRGNDGDAEDEVEFTPDGISTAARIVVVGASPGGGSDASTSNSSFVMPGATGTTGAVHAEHRCADGSPVPACPSVCAAVPASFSPSSPGTPAYHSATGSAGEVGRFFSALSEFSGFESETSTL